MKWWKAMLWKRYLVYNTCSVLHWGRVQRGRRHSPHQLAMNSSWKGGVGWGGVLDWGMPSPLSGPLCLPGTPGEHCCYKQTRTRSLKCRTYKVKTDGLCHSREITPDHTSSQKNKTLRSQTYDTQNIAQNKLLTIWKCIWMQNVYLPI